MNMTGHQPKKEVMVPNAEGATLIDSEIPTAPIMIGSEMKKSAALHFSEAQHYPRKKSAPAIHPAVDGLSGRLGSMHISEGPTATTNNKTLYISSNQQKRRASVDDAMMVGATSYYQTRGDPTLHSGQRDRRSQRPSPALFDESAGTAHSTDKRIVLYKTEMCRTFEETGICKYGVKCQFAHDRTELRNIPRHPRYKTEICRTFWEQGQCPYGKRCCFIHTENSVAQAAQSSMENQTPTEDPVLNQTEESRILNRLHKPDTVGSSLPASSYFNLESFCGSRLKSSYKEEHFLDFLSAGPIGSAPNNIFTIGSFSNKPISHRPSFNDPLFESTSIPSDPGHSDSPWDEESIGLLPSDLITYAE